MSSMSRKEQMVDQHEATGAQPGERHYMVTWVAARATLPMEWPNRKSRQNPFKV